LPQDIIVVDESITSGAGLREFLPRRHARDYFGLKGGGIGWGLPATMGQRWLFQTGQYWGSSAMAAPCIAFRGCGQQRAMVCAAFSSSATTVSTLSLKRRLQAYNGPASKAQTYIGIDLHAPAIQFTGLARSLGVHAERVERPADLQQALKEALQRQGPTLIDVRSTLICRRRNAIPTGGLCCMTDASEYFPPRLRGQVAVITGAARGLGRAYALRLARLGQTSW
jgi:benzoylformate decarboxylase